MTFANRAARTEAKNQTAKEMNTTIRRVNHLKLCNKPLESVLKREKKAKKALEHRENCLNVAKSVVNRLISARNAAKECGITERQMARYIQRAIKEIEDDKNVR